jgi:hypothetical protein
MKREKDRILTWSSGGGTQSIAIAILIVKGKLPMPEWIGMADTSREGSETFEYHEKYIKPLLATVGLEVDIISHDLATVDLYGHNGDLLLPVYTEKGKLPTYCSNEWKRHVVRRRLRERGYGPDKPVTTWIGMSVDEIGRLKESELDWQEYQWPLVFDMRMTRLDCKNIIRDYGLPEPPKSSCWMCPHRHNDQWRKLRDEYPEDWRKAVELDNAVRERDKFHAVYLHKDRVPLDQANIEVNPDEGLGIFGGVDACDSGFCFV